MTASEEAVPTSIPHWIDGSRRAGASARIGPVTDPATGELTGAVAFASGDEVDAAVAAAVAAFPGWRDTPLATRAAVLFRFRELLNARKAELAGIVTAENGKALDDALGEVSRGQEVVEFACGVPALVSGQFTASAVAVSGVAFPRAQDTALATLTAALARFPALLDASTPAPATVDVHSTRQPLGPVAVISPFNFPAMVPMWFFPIAIACGNTVVLKPSEKAPSASLWMAELWQEAGLPDGVFNVVQGDRVAVDRLLEHPGIKGVSFVGSTPVARHVYETGTRHGKRVQALGGAKNHMVVLPDADMNLAADSAVTSGFGSAGQRCMAISVVVTVGGIGDDLVARIAKRTRTLRTGDGRKGCDLGPLVTREHRDRVRSYVDIGEQEGATVVVDGRQVQPDGLEHGFWLGPTVLDHVQPHMKVYRDEIFGPVLSVVRVDSYEDALALVNGSEYGNGTAIFTSDGGAAHRFQHEVEVGMVGVNVPIPVPMASYSFGGWKSSLFGDSHAYGTDGVHFFTRGKVVTSRWLDDRGNRGPVVT